MSLVSKAQLCHFLQANNEPIYTVLIMGVLVCLVILPVMSVSGGMFNPLLATVLFAGCQGHTMAEHILVYWVGAFGGSVIAFLVYPGLKNAIYATKPEKKTN